jgi:anthranilate synthase/aminodeoxychorismate synthase-like glutamine amidotransferase
MILIIDNYDSFTYNLVQRLGELGEKVVVRRNDKINLKQVTDMKPSGIIISPGPCTPNETGISNSVIKRLGPKIPVLGVCLGHQCVGYVFGAKVVKAKKPMHGKVSLIYHDGKKVYSGIKSPFTSTRYHSLVLEKKSMPSCLNITAETKEGIVMGIRHQEYPIEGVQWHPESILTKMGMKALKNFINTLP